MLALVLALALTPLQAIDSTDQFDLSDLENEPKLTPGHFADLFEYFTFQYFDYVQPPDVFLQTRTGDCDDYAILADHVLRFHRYTTRLIRVDLAGARISHAVCYVTEAKAYLDYNNREYFRNLTRKGPRIRDIATSVAASFGKNWTSATEYTYTYEEGRTHAVMTVVKTDPPDEDPDANRH